MIHKRRQTLAELANLLEKVKVGDRLEVEADYSSRIFFSGGIGCVTNVTDIWDDNGETEESSPATVVDVRYLLSNTCEKNIDLSRVTVIPMPYRGARPTLRRAA
jgi:hypothetical protein